MRHVYPIVATPLLNECRDFYVRALGAKLLFEQDWYLHLSIDGWEIGFMRPSHGKRLPLFQHGTATRGLCLALEVDDLVKTHDALVAKGVDPLGPMSLYPGGERSFSVMDPAGTVINFVEREGAAGDVLEI